MLQRMAHYFHSEKVIGRPGLPNRAPTEYFRDCEIYFTCEGDEKLLPKVLKCVGDDKMMISGDMPHAEGRDNSITEIKERNDISDAQKKNSTYYLPYMPHFCMEVLNCSVNYTGNKCEIWAPTQSSGGVATTAKGLTGFNTDQIIVHTTFLGGGLGRKFEVDFVSQAIQAAMQLYQKTGSRAVKLMWLRDEDFAYDQYRPMSLVRVQLGINNGATSLKYRAVSPSIRQQRQADPTLPLATADSLAVEGAAASNYGFLARKVEHVWHPAGGPVGYWRSVGHSINSFVLESAIDESAAKANKDPLEFRRELLKANLTNPKAARALAVVNAAADLSPWRDSLPSGHAWGIAYAEAYGSLVCEVVDISQPAAGSIKIHRVACAIDCGVAINPPSSSKCKAALSMGSTPPFGANKNSSPASRCTRISTVGVC